MLGVGGIGYHFWTTLHDRKTTQKDVWGLWLESWVANLILEYRRCNMGVHTYYGYQPFTMGGSPLWLPAVNSFTLMVGAAIANLMGLPRLKGWKKIAIIPIVASSYPIGNAAAGCPISGGSCDFGSAVHLRLGDVETVPRGKGPVGDEAKETAKILETREI